MQLFSKRSGKQPTRVDGDDVFEKFDSPSPLLEGSPVGDSKGISKGSLNFPIFWLLKYD